MRIHNYALRTGRRNSQVKILNWQKGNSYIVEVVRRKLDDQYEIASPLIMPRTVAFR